MKSIPIIVLITVVFVLSACQSRTPADNTTLISAAATPQLSDSESSFIATKKTDAAESRGQASVKPYPFRTCAVQINRPFKNGKPRYRRVYQGYEVLICCDPCLKAFDAYPDAFMPRIKEAVAAKEARQAG